MVGRVRSRPQAPVSSQGKSSGSWPLLAGAAAFAVKSYAWDPVDLAVHRSGGPIVRHLRPLYNPHLPALVPR